MVTALARLLGGGLLLLLLATPARAEDQDRAGALDDVKMEVVGDPDADERDYVDEIALPPGLAGPGTGEARGRGQSTAREARERGREFGQSTAREARERGREAGNAASGGKGANAGEGSGGGPP